MRPCGWCRSSAAQRRRWEAAVLDGQTLQQVAAKTPYSQSAARRHMTEHVRAVQVQRMRRERSADLHVSSFAQRFLSLADEAGQVRDDTDDPRVKLLGIREEREALSVLLSRLGIGSEEATVVVTEAQVLASALSVVLVGETRVLARLVAELRERGQHDLAEAFERMLNSAQGAAPRQLAEVTA